MFLVFLYTCYKYGSGVFGTNMYYIIMGSVMLGLAVWLFYKKVYRYGLLKKACTIPVEARIYAVDSKFGGKGGRFYNVTYEYYFNERRYINNRDIWEQTRWHRPQEGEIVTILINPNFPEDYYDFILNNARKNGILIGIISAICSVMIFAMPFVVT